MKIKNKKAKSIWKLSVFSLFLLVSFLAVENVNAGTKDLGQACQKGSDCKSEFCGENGYGGAAFTCQGKLTKGAKCSLYDQKQACGYNLYCHADTRECTEDNRGLGPNPDSSTLNNQANIPPTSSSCPTCFTNPLRFDSVEGFLSNFLVVMQRIIVTIALVMIVIGAFQYIAAGATGQTEAGKKTITAALIGLAIGIAAPSLLKELGSVIGWGGVNSSAVQVAPTLTEIATRILNFLLGTMGILSLVMLVIGGIMYLTSAGDSKQVETGKNIFKYSLMGVLIAMVSMVLVTQIARIITGG